MKKKELELLVKELRCKLETARQDLMNEINESWDSDTFQEFLERRFDFGATEGLHTYNDRKGGRCCLCGIHTPQKKLCSDLYVCGFCIGDGMTKGQFWEAVNKKEQEEENG